MHVSVVIPAYNAAKYLPAALDSVLAQTCSDWSLLLINDGSTDTTPAVAAAYAARDPRIRLLEQPNRGLARTRNRGIEEADPLSKALLFLDADDMLEPDALAALTGALAASPTAPAAHGVARFIDAAGRPFQRRTDVQADRRRAVVGRRLVPWPVSAPTTFAVLVWRNCIWTPGQVLLRREALKVAGPFDPAISPVADWDLWLRLTMRSDIVFVNQPVLAYRQHTENMSGNHSLMAEAEAQMRRKFWTRPDLSPEQRRLLLRGYRFSERSVCAYRLQWAWDALRQAHAVQAAKQLRHALRSYAASLRGCPEELAS